MPKKFFAFILLSLIIALEASDFQSYENPCNLIDCRDGYHCVVDKGSPTCVLKSNDNENPCNLIDCRDGYHCVVDKGSPTCVLKSNGLTCNPPCKSGTKCTPSTIQCVRAPCPEAAPSCTPIKETTTTELPCTAKCSPYEKCELQPSTNCAYTPCLPVPTCVPTLTCANVLCIPGSRCIESSDGPKCVPVDTCSTLSCPSGQKCVQTNMNINAKCEPVITCASTSCPVGSTCTDFPNSDAKCSISNDDPKCDAVCNYDEECVFEDVPASECYNPPCGSAARCVPKKPTNRCANVRCIDGTTCMETPTGPKCTPNTQKCGNNEIWKTCPTCEPTCQNPSPICATVCRTPRCECVSGFVRDTAGKCVKENGCPTYTTTKSYQTYVSGNGTEPPKACNILCVVGTKCVVTPSGPKCVPNEDSSDQYPTKPECNCAPGEECVKVQIQCITTPCDPIFQCQKAKTSCAATTCPVGYTCAEGSNGAECLIPPPAQYNQGPSNCSANETLNQCGNLCEAKCEHIGKGPIACIEICAPAACVCNDGLYRNSSNQCVPASSCSYKKVLRRRRPSRVASQKFQRNENKVMKKFPQTLHNRQNIA